jgi:hypothetical protein
MRAAATVSPEEGDQQCTLLAVANRRQVDRPSKRRLQYSLILRPFLAKTVVRVVEALWNGVSLGSEALVGRSRLSQL